MAPPETALSGAPLSACADVSPSDAASARDLLIAALREAAPLALEHFRPEQKTTAKIWKKSDGSSVTEADLAVNEALKKRLLAAMPEAGWLSEEEAEDETPEARLSRRLVFVLDPIDGTRSYIEGSDAFCLSLALAVDGAVIAAGVYAPASGRMYDAALSVGARLNEEPLAGPRDTTAPPLKIMSTARDLKPEQWRGDAPEAERSYMQPIAHRLCRVAAGVADGLIALKCTHEWDIAAAALIAREAGLTVTDAYGAPLRYNKPEPTVSGLLAAPPAVHADWLTRGPRHTRR